MDSLLKLAQENNPTIAQAAAQLRGEEGKAKQAGLWYNPELRYEDNAIGVHYEGRDGGTGFSAGDFQGLNIEQRVVTAGKLRLSREKYQARVQAANDLLKMHILQVTNDVRIRYFETLAKSRLVDIHREMLKTMEDHWLTTKEKLNEGQSNDVEYRQSKIALNRERLRTRMAENDYRATVERLGALVGVDLSSSAISGPLEDEIALIDFDAGIARVLTQSPELAEAKVMLKSHEITVRREKVQPIPDLYFSRGWGYTFQYRQPIYNAGLRLTLPLFDRNQGTVETAEADLVRQQREVKRVELDLRHRFADQYELYLTSLQHVEDYRETILPEAKQAYETQLKSYKLGREDWPAVLAVQRAYEDRREEYVRNRLAWRKSETAINGLLLVKYGLMAPDGVTPPGGGTLDVTSKPR
ncbi:MAG: TolC family protein [Acidobacteriota bacterium]|nr:TolC family protein [Acidobacteriota bacterium]